MTIKKITNFDYLLLLIVLILTGIGILFIYSSGVNSDGVSVSKEYIKQIIWAITGVILLIATTFYDYQKFKDRTFLLFIIALLFLVYTPIFGHYSKGAKSWIGIGEFGIQISEFTKVIYILYLAYYLDKSKNENPFKRFIKASCIMAIPMGLILLQPDLGTASVYIPIFLIMCFIAGLPLRFVFGLLSIVLLTLVFTLLPLWEKAIIQHPGIATKIFSNKSVSALIFLSLATTVIIAAIGYMRVKRKYYYWVTYVLILISLSFGMALVGIRVLKPYQMMRLIIFLDPNVDPLNAGWHILQSMIAIGGGGTFGMGFLKGTQSHYRFLPQQSTDFIFSILSEEWGFVGGVAVFMLYLLFFIRILLIMKHTDVLYEKLIASGILGMFFFHFIVNVGMVMGIMPITGIPLLLLSYGGSSLWTAMIATGLLISIDLRRV
ncbi:rod shape-determining protein RodA [Treponema phagedenis]|uniref:Peptidoglycan glycosyltransferase RodA n=1 Tax=Treponema phagedenis TaxID=162 RepID=A0AAE6M8W8_TREPH|nr:rod shape-determining protein RodA [Treponema phagedenis]QEJ98879.1 rod shape-determining protein RodA [Treponema phagedenis]